MIAEDRCRQDGRDLPLSRAAPADDQRAGRTAGLVIGPDLGCTPASRNSVIMERDLGPAAWPRAGPGTLRAREGRAAAACAGAGRARLAFRGPL